MNYVSVTYCINGLVGGFVVGYFTDRFEKKHLHPK